MEHAIFDFVKAAKLIKQSGYKNSKAGICMHPHFLIANEENNSKHNLDPLWANTNIQLCSRGIIKPLTDKEKALLRVSGNPADGGYIPTIMIDGEYPQECYIIETVADPDNGWPDEANKIFDENENSHKL